MKKLITLKLFLFLFIGNGFSKGSEEIMMALQKKYSCSQLSFSSDIEDFFDSHLEIEGVKKYIKGDFHKAGILIMDEAVKADSLVSVFKKHGFIQYSNKDLDQDIKILGMKSGKKISELHLIIENEESSMIFSIYGEIEVEKEKN